MIKESKKDLEKDEDIHKLTEEDLKNIGIVKNLFPVFKSHKDNPKILAIPFCKTKCKLCTGRGYVFGNFNTEEKSTIKVLDARPIKRTVCPKSKFKTIDALAFYKNNKKELLKTVKNTGGTTC